MKLRKLALILIGISIITTTGCSKTVMSTKDAAIVMEQSLLYKYGKEFSVTELKKGDDGVNFSHPYYQATAVCEKDGTIFRLRIETDGTDLKDDYEGNFYKEKIEDDIKNIELSHPDIIISNEEIISLLSKRYCGTLTQYQKSGATMLMADMTVTAENTDDAINKVFSFIDDIQDKGYGYSLDIRYNNINVILYQEMDYEKLTKDQLANKFIVMNEI